MEQIFRGVIDRTLRSHGWCRIQQGPLKSPHFFKTEGLSFVSTAVEEETEIRSDLRRFAGCFKKGFVPDKGLKRIKNNMYKFKG